MRRRYKTSLYIFVLHLLLYLQLPDVLEAQSSRGPLASCGEIQIPSDYSWNSTAVARSLNSTSPPWSSSSFNSVQTVFAVDTLTVNCGWSNTLNQSLCGFIQTRLNDTLGPFLKIDLDVEWPPVSPPVYAPAITFQKKTGAGGVFENDTVGMVVQPINDTYSIISVYFVGATTYRVTPKRKVPLGGYGRHLLTMIWDNSSVIGLIDGVQANQALRRANDTEWAEKSGFPNMYTSYDVEEITPVVSSDTLGPNGTSVIFHALNMQCISPFASDCYLKPNPIPGVATCDILTGTWTTPPGPVIQLNSSNVDPTGELVLNVTTTVLHINGSIILGGGILIEPEGEVNVTGDITFRGILTLNVSSTELSNGTASIVLISYQNYTGNFSEIQLVGTPKDLRPCERLSATPDYGRNRFTVILSINSSACNGRSQKKNISLALILGVAGAVVLIAIIAAGLLVVFCRSSAVLHRRRQTRTKLFKGQAVDVIS